MVAQKTIICENFHMGACTKEVHSLEGRGVFHCFRIVDENGRGYLGYSDACEIEIDIFKNQMKWL